MIYKSYLTALLIRILLLLTFLTALAFGISMANTFFVSCSAVLSLVSLYNLYRFTTRRFKEMDDFFQAVKYRDFSRWFNEKTSSQDLRELYKGFNAINRTIWEINTERQAQYVYLQKILEMVDVGIIAYNLQTGNVLWMNESFKETLDFPSFRNISFVEKRRPDLFNAIFNSAHSLSNSTDIEVKKEKLKVLISDTVFRVEKDSFKLIILQNIDETLDRNESQAWKKLLSVMTHEIMNSIAPISSLADTLQTHVQASLKSPIEHPLEMEDLSAGIKSIKNRSEGLMKFAKTYRSLNKITTLNLQSTPVKELFENLRQLMLPSLQSKNIHLEFKHNQQDMALEIDKYLIEQVLINLMLNAVEALENQENRKIIFTSATNFKGHTVIQIADNGQGIPPEILDTVFVPFFSTKKNGSGIGLSLCKQIMMLHKGKIQINSQEGEGTVVSLIF